MIARTVFCLGLAACFAGVSPLAMAQEMGTPEARPPPPWRRRPALALITQHQLPRKRALQLASRLGKLHEAGCRARSPPWIPCRSPWPPIP